MDIRGDLFLRALLSEAYFRGAIIAILLGVVILIVGTAVGLVLAILRDHKRAPLRAIATSFVWLFRALPELLLLILAWNALPQLFPALKSDWYNPFFAALLAFGLHEAAIMTEIIRAGIGSVAAGQKLAARGLALAPYEVFRWVLLPQIIKTVIPSAGNRLIVDIKITTLASVIALQELLTAARRDVSSHFSYAEFYGAAALYYLAIVSVLMVLQKRLERRYEWSSASDTRNANAAEAIRRAGIPTRSIVKGR